MLGDLVLDVVAERESALVSGSDAPGRLRFRVGGSAANTARAFASIGGDAVFIGSVGDDGAGRELAAELRRAGVTTRIVAHQRLRTARLLVSLAPDGERTFLTERGAADLLAEGDLDVAWFRRAAGLHLPLYSLLAEPLASAARRARDLVQVASPGSAVVSVDLASAAPLATIGLQAAGQVIGSVAPHLLFANGAEAVVYGARAWPARLLELAPIVVVKQGAAGCEVLARAQGDAPPRRFTVATRPLTVSDATGAGDAFDAGFLHSVLSAGVEPAELTAAHLRSAAVAGNRAATRWLRSRRLELDW